MRWLTLLLCLLGTSALAGPQVLIETTLGKITVELDAENAPVSTANFLGYVDSGFYDGTLFHRVIPSFMIQGGGYGTDSRRKSTGAPIANEADNGLKNRRGTLAMARTADPHSATAQFFINTVDNRPLDHTAKTMNGWGYAVFGRVIEGMDVVDAIERTPTGQASLDGYPAPDVPSIPVVILKASRVPEPEPAEPAQAAPAEPPAQ